MSTVTEIHPSKRYVKLCYQDLEVIRYCMCELDEDLTQAERRVLEKIQTIMHLMEGKKAREDAAALNHLVNG